MPKMLCLGCDRIFTSNVTIPQCGVCAGRDIISISRLYEIADIVSRHINYTNIDTLPYLEVMTAVLQVTGLRLKPVSTLKLSIKIHEILRKKWRQNMSNSISIAGDGTRGI